MTTPRKDHLKYLQQLTDRQYSYYDEEEEDNTPDDSWIWAEPPAKEKMKNIIFNGIVDATALRKEQIKGALSQAKNIQVGEFTLRMSSYYGKDPIEQGNLSFSVYKKQFKTATGQPCNMDMKFDLTQDNRFTGRPWLTYFKGAWARDMPIDTVVEVVRWMQGIRRMKAFL